MDNYYKFATFGYPETIPVGASLFAPTWRRHGEALEEIVLRHPNIFPSYKKGQYLDSQKASERWQYQTGKHTDHWGCEWDNLVDGHDSFCVRAALPDLGAVDKLEIPEEDIGCEHGFLFLRLTYLRGYENAMIDFIEGKPEFFKLIDKVVKYTERQIEIALKRMKPEDYIIGFGDDLGMQTSLPINPGLWRKILKPRYCELYAPCKERGKIVYMHSDGCIHEIIPDLKDCGVDIINPQIRANGLENLKRATRGEGRNKIAVNLDLDRQLFPFATPAEILDHIMECVEELYLPSGGLAVFAEIAEDIPLENIAAICEGLEKARVYK